MEKGNSSGEIKVESKKELNNKGEKINRNRNRNRNRLVMGNIITIPCHLLHPLLLRHHQHHQHYCA